MKNVRFGILLTAGLLAMMLPFLSGCANTAAPQPVQLEQKLGQICASYIAIMKGATVANNTGKLNDAQRAAISKADEEALPICTGPTPTNLDDAITKVTAAVTTIAINAALEQAK